MKKSLFMIISRIKKFDFLLIFSALAVAFIGILSIYSSTPHLFFRQLIFIILGLFVMYLVSFFDWRVFRDNPYFVLIFYFFSVTLLLGLFFFAPAVRDVYRWYVVGPVMVDPAEIAKLALIILLAKFFSTRYIEMYRVSHIILSGVYAAIPAFLIFRQPDLGSSLILVIMWMGMLLISGVRLRHFAILCLAGLMVFSFGWSFFLQDYQKDRVISFLQPDFDPQGIGWGQSQAKIAVGNGGILGEGFRSGSQTQYGFLPEPHTDYIFAAIAEEFGFLGISALLGFFALFLWRVVLIILRSKTNFPRLFASGFLIVVFVQVFVNIGMNLGIMPIVGTPLPLVSYGGSSLLFVFVGIGILQNIRKI